MYYDIPNVNILYIFPQSNPNTVSAFLLYCKVKAITKGGVLPHIKQVRV